MIEIIPNIQELGEYLELADRYSLGFEYNDFFAPQLLDDQSTLREHIDVYRRLGRPAGIDTMHGAFYDLVPFSLDAGIRNHSLYRMQQSVEIAGMLGCRAVVFHAGLNPRFVNGGPYYQNWLESMENTLRKLLTQDGSVAIYCENMLEDSPDGLAELAERLQDEKRFGICLDVAHMLLAGGEPEKWMEKLSPYIRHFHLNDTKLKTDDHLALGRGGIDWENIFALIRKSGNIGASRLLEMRGLENIRESLAFLEKFDEL